MSFILNDPIIQMDLYDSLHTVYRSYIERATGEMYLANDNGIDNSLPKYIHVLTEKHPINHLIFALFTIISDTL